MRVVKILGGKGTDQLDLRGKGGKKGSVGETEQKNLWGGLCWNIGGDVEGGSRGGGPGEG